MMLDMKRTFDEVVLAHSTPETAGSILENPFYVALSSQFAGTQEYMAMEKLGQLHARRGDRLLGPDRGRHTTGPLGAGLPGRARAPQLAAGRAVPEGAAGRRPRTVPAGQRGFNLVAGALNKILGGRLLTDLQTFIAAFEAIFGGFRQRANQTFQLLASPQTTFLVVATPQRDALREAAYFVDRLARRACRWPAWW